MAHVLSKYRIHFRVEEQRTRTVRNDIQNNRGGFVG